MKRVMSGWNPFLRHPPWAIDPKLAHRRKGVGFGVVPIDELHDLAAPLVPVGKTIDGHPLEEPLRRLLVRLHEAGGGDAIDRADGLRDAAVVEPGLTLAKVHPPERLGQVVLDEHLPEVRAPRHRGVVDVPNNNLPA